MMPWTITTCLISILWSISNAQSGIQLDIALKSENAYRIYQRMCCNDFLGRCYYVKRKFLLILGYFCHFLFFFIDPPCSQPTQIEHGITNWDGKSSFAKYACYQGYHLVGPPAVECRYGRWYSDAAPATFEHP